MVTGSLTHVLALVPILCVLLTLSVRWSQKPDGQKTSVRVALEMLWQKSEQQANDNEVELEAKREAMHADYDRRLKSALLAGRRMPVPRSLRWLHIPKTGTSFINTFVRWGCPSAPRDIFIVPPKEQRPAYLSHTFKGTFVSHYLGSKPGRVWLRKNCEGRLMTKYSEEKEHRSAFAGHKGLKEWELSMAIAFFRLPLQRMYSKYQHLYRHFNASQQPGEPLTAYLNNTEHWSQQTKKLLGRKFNDTGVVSEGDALKAAGIVSNKLLFVGLTEEFELSCRLFHARFGGIPHKVQLENVRPGISRYQATGKSGSGSFRYDEAEFAGWRDPADHIVYDAARIRFWNDVKEAKDEIEVDGLGEVAIKLEYLKD